jgi:hypothetical protein
VIRQNDQGSTAFFIEPRNSALAALMIPKDIHR